jgi:hypothetical protein
MKEKQPPTGNPPENLPWTGKTFKEIKEIKKRHTDRIMGNPEIVKGFGIGYDSDEKSRHYVFEIYVNSLLLKKNLDELNTNIEGVPIRYTVTGEINTLVATSSQETETLLKEFITTLKKPSLQRNAQTHKLI